MLICERPYFANEVGMLARKNGKYTRPILVKLVDMRIEDFLPDEILFSEKHASNYIAKLPDIPEINQIDKHLLVTSNMVSRTDAGTKEVEKFMKSGQFIMLPHSPKSALWKYSKSPWWEYAMCMDDHNGYIKAALKHRANEVSPEEIDERLDDFERNRNRLDVLSPQTLERYKDVQVESYLEKLARI